MKKIFILNGSRRKEGNTAKFIRSISNKLNEFDVEISHPQDFNIETCVGCHQCFLKAKCVQLDDLSLLEEKILNADLFILASPVYLHYMSGELKMILDKFAWWAHTLRLQGKPVVLLSTCSTNGQDSVIKPLGEIMNFMGGNVIATANASSALDQLNNPDWIKEVSEEIVKRIKQSIEEPPQSNSFLENIFTGMKIMMQGQAAYLVENDMEKEELGELKFWENSGMIEFKTFSDYLKHKYQ
ncbi:MAG: flavodoxin family protein [Streptococcaceae bacterium]|jgi:multimeric flavodoxin WrbA|nr:flavodoxin family protein [Streptococcaceae bacterium]